MEGEARPLEEIVEYARKLCRELKELPCVRPRGQGAISTGPMPRWQPPGEGWVKINTDAGVLSDVGSGLGVVCRKEDGSVLGCEVIQATVRWEVRVAEAKAVLEGLHFARELGLSHIMVESDCLVLIQALQKKNEGC